MHLAGSSFVAVAECNAMHLYSSTRHSRSGAPVLFLIFPLLLVLLWDSGLYIIFWVGGVGGSWCACDAGIMISHRADIIGILCLMIEGLKD
jgi:hypothetical protein